MAVQNALNEIVLKVKIHLICLYKSIKHLLKLIKRYVLRNFNGQIIKDCNQDWACLAISNVRKC